jgi:hypothetical protein
MTCMPVARLTWGVGLGGAAIRSPRGGEKHLHASAPVLRVKASPVLQSPCFVSFVSFRLLFRFVRIWHSVRMRPLDDCGTSARGHASATALERRPAVQTSYVVPRVWRAPAGSCLIS